MAEMTHEAKATVQGGVEHGMFWTRIRIFQWREGRNAAGGEQCRQEYQNRQDDKEDGNEQQNNAWDSPAQDQVPVDCQEHNLLRAHAPPD